MILRIFPLFILCLLSIDCLTCVSSFAILPRGRTTSYSDQQLRQQQQQLRQQRQLLQRRTSSTSTPSLPPLFMGRAAVVRAQSKARTDSQKTKINGTYGKRLILAVKQGGGSGDPKVNRLLADVIRDAKAHNVPGDNINRAIHRAVEGSGGEIAESIMEAYGLGGASFIIHVLTDNLNRARMSVRSVITKRDAKMAEGGSVVFMYDRKGKVLVPALLHNDEEAEEALLEAAIDAGIEDYTLEVDRDVEQQEDGSDKGTSAIYVEPKDTASMMDVVTKLGYENSKMSQVYLSKAPIECSQEDFELNMQIVDALEELEDVDRVEHNMYN